MLACAACEQGYPSRRDTDSAHTVDWLWRVRPVGLLTSHMELRCCDRLNGVSRLSGDGLSSWLIGERRVMSMRGVRGERVRVACSDGVG